MAEGHFASLYRRWMEAQGLTANAAAPKIGVSHQTSYEYAAGTSLPPRTRLPALALALGIPLDDLTRAVEADRAAATATPSTAAPAAGW